jgi:hypothetical protein
VAAAASGAKRNSIFRLDVASTVSGGVSGIEEDLTWSPSNLPFSLIWRNRNRHG